MGIYGTELPKGAILDDAQGYGAELPKGAVVDQPSEIQERTIEQPQEQPNPMAPLMQKLASGEKFTQRQNEALAELIKRGKISGESFSAMGIPGSRAIGESQGLDPATQPAYETLKNIGKVYPALETAVNAITSSYGIPASGLAGILSLPLGVDKAAENVEAVQKALVYEPQTEGGKELTESTAYPFQKVAEGAEVVADPIAEAGFPGTASVVSAGIQTLPAIFGAKKIIKSGVKSLSAETKKMIRNRVEKSIRPSVAGKKTRSQIKDYHSKAATAVEEIVANKENLNIVDETGAKTGKLPETLDQFSQAIEQTKRDVFEQYDALAKEGGAAKERRPLQYPLKKESGESIVVEGGKPYLEKNAVMVDLDKTSKKLEPVLNNKTLQDLSPETIEYANKRIESLKGSKEYTALETQEAIQFLNQTLESFYRDPTPALKGKALVDSLIANDLRKQLDTAISKSTGKEYTALKKKYGALKTIEADVTKRAIVDARKNNKGLLDFSDVFTGGHVVSGMLRAEPSAAITGVAGKGIASYYKMLNDPNKIVKSMFKDVEKAGKKTKPSKLPGVGAIVGTEMQASKQENK